MPGESLLTCVGSFDASRMSCLQSWSASYTAVHLIQVNCVDFRAIRWLMGPNKAFPAGMTMAAWRSFPSISSIRLNGTPFLIHSTVFNLSRIAFCFFSASSIHRVAPSMTHLNISFLASQSPSPSLVFLTEIGSSPLWPEIYGGEKTLWIPCNRAQLR